MHEVVLGTDLDTVPVANANERPAGCWVAYYSDRSAIAVFGTELEALRHAVDRTMSVRFQQWGEVDFR